MVAIVVDSAANVPSDLATELGISTVPLYLHLGGTVYRDGVDLPLSQFYQQLRDGAASASTATPSAGDFLAAFEATGESEVLCVTVASGVSASHHQAVLAGERFEGRVEVVDSRSASMAEGFVAVDAARRLRAGAPLEELAARARELAGRTWLYATVATFDYLRRSGRVTKLQAYAATMLDIKPVFRMHDGDIEPVARTRTRARALARLVDETVERGAAGGPMHLAVVHADAEDDARAVADRILERTAAVETWIVPVTTVIGAHTGPGLVGTAFHGS